MSSPSWACHPRIRVPVNPVSHDGGPFLSLNLPSPPLPPLLPRPTVADAGSSPSQRLLSSPPCSASTRRQVPCFPCCVFCVVLGGQLDQDRPLSFRPFYFSSLFCRTLKLRRVHLFQPYPTRGSARLACGRDGTKFISRWGKKRDQRAHGFVCGHAVLFIGPPAMPTRPERNQPPPLFSQVRCTTPW